MKTALKNLLIITPAIFFIACGDNTDTPVVKDISSINITDSNVTMYSTDFSKTLNASVTYDDNTTASIINTPDMWTNSNYDALSMYNGIITPASNNGGSSIVGIEVGSFSDEINVTVLKLTSFDFNTTADVNTSGEYYTLIATGTFEDNNTATIHRNIIWTATNSATIIYEDNVTKVSFIEGETNVTATVFGETNTSAELAPITKTYNIN